MNMKNKVKILFVITRATQSGPIRVIENIIDHLDLNIFELYLISIEEESKERSILRSFQTKFYNYQYIPVSKVEAILGKFGKLRKAIKDINPDVIHSNGIVPDLIISKICPERQLIIAHANYHIDYSYLLGSKLKGELLARLHIRIMKRAKTCIACSKSLSELYKKDHLNMRYIRNGVQVDKFNFVDKSIIRNKLGLPKNKKIFIYAASFNNRKNQKFLVTVFEKYLNEHVLLLLGDGPTFSDIKEYTNAKNIFFLGRKKDVKPYLQASDYFISSSKQEGMPMGVLEGMAEGLPVILSNIDQHIELFTVNDKIGVLFSLNSVDDLVKKTRQLVNMNYESMSLSAYNTILNDFNSEVMGQKYQKEYILIANSLENRGR